ncbi:unnamed protein product [Medioppia subpectinata]|uniref:Cytosolic fatty-acid binding proteins domain-containing protein n=1 Tax=Medioppia subpectinata TaxID=1979941 RepID=A0A7R9PX89_9ACAR|nr:unnamed protein product [Medioppia subpectinata]CAG2104142.1 unnamed protein product [Medioppia subpectinata]
MTDYTGNFKLVSSENFDALLRELGVSEEVVKSVQNTTQELEITKAGDVYTSKTISPNRTHEIKFELGKEFDEPRPDGKTVKSVVVADGNRLVQTSKSDKEVKVVREYNGNELRVTVTAGPVVAVRTYAKQ